MDNCTEYPKSVQSLPDMYPWRDGISTTGSSTHEHQERSICVEFFFQVDTHLIAYSLTNLLSTFCSDTLSHYKTAPKHF
jgi:hypothetical protein